ncbi:MAG: hypothetical protein KF686_16010 [Ramlibacter sp.]|nr:hypothetical protein [Ramlibacter sp.]
MSVTLGPFAKVADAKFGGLRARVYEYGVVGLSANINYDGWDGGFGPYGIQPRFRYGVELIQATRKKDGDFIFYYPQPNNGAYTAWYISSGPFPAIRRFYLPIKIDRAPVLLKANGDVVLPTPRGLQDINWNDFEALGSIQGTGFLKAQRGDAYGVCVGTATVKTYSDDGYVVLLDAALLVTPILPMFPFMRDNLLRAGQVLQILDDLDHVVWQSAPAVEIDIERTLAAANPGGVAPPLLVYGWIDSPTESQLIDTWTIF